MLFRRPQRRAARPCNALAEISEASVSVPNQGLSCSSLGGGAPPRTPRLSANVLLNPVSSVRRWLARSCALWQNVTVGLRGGGDFVVDRVDVLVNEEHGPLLANVGQEEPPLLSACWKTSFVRSTWQFALLRSLQDVPTIKRSTRKTAHS